MRVLTYERLLQRVWVAGGDADFQSIPTGLSKMRRWPRQPHYVITDWSLPICFSLLLSAPPCDRRGSAGVVVR